MTAGKRDGMRGLTELRLLILETESRRHRLRLLNPVSLDRDPQADYRLLGGEALCQYLLRGDPQAMVIARGPMPFLSGNKTTVGYLSPLTGLPHYSFVGGRGFAELLNLGLDAIVLTGREARMDIHLTPQEIQAVIERSLDRSEWERLLEHLDHCPPCVKWLSGEVRERQPSNAIH